MPRPNLSLMGGVLLGMLTALPAQAHKTEVSGNVAGTWHLEPDHSAKAGEPARLWVALTQPGGKVIPLDQCDCQLAVYRANQAGDPPILQPTLQAMSPESFENIPGTEIIFPSVGEYRIVLTGSPKAEGRFTPFELSYTTVVAAGRTAAPAPPPEAAPSGTAQSNPVITPSQASEPTAQTLSNRSLWGLGIAVGGVGLAIATWLRLAQKQKR